MVSAYWEQPLFQGDIADWLLTTEIGTPARNITNLNSRGFEVVYQEGSLQFLASTLQQGQPCIAFVYTIDLPYWQVNTAHAVVLAGLEQDSIVIYDPAFADAPMVTSIGDFMLAWSHFDYAVAVLTPKK